MKLTLAGTSAVVKLLIPPNPSDISELHRVACAKLQVEPDEFLLQYFDADFNDYINLTDITEVCNLLSLRLCKKVSANEAASELVGSEAVGCAGNMRQTAWPQQFEVPLFDAIVQLFLKSAEDNFAATSVSAVVRRDVKVKILDSLANRIFSYTAYPSSEQIRQVAKALTDKYPSLKCDAAPSGWEAWAHAISFKVGNYRSKMRKLGSVEVQLNSGRYSKLSRPQAPPPAANIKKARKGEVNFQPNLPSTETAESIEKYRSWMVAECAKSDPDMNSVKRYMSLTFAARRKEINDMALVRDIKERWPALFTSSQVCVLYVELSTSYILSLDAMPAWYMLSSCVCSSHAGIVSVPLNVGSGEQSVLHDSPGTQVFWCPISRLNTYGVTHSGGAKCGF